MEECCEAGWLSFGWRLRGPTGAALRSRRGHGGPRYLLDAATQRPRYPLRFAKLLKYLHPVKRALCPLYAKRGHHRVTAPSLDWSRESI